MKPRPALLFLFLLALMPSSPAQEKPAAPAAAQPVKVGVIDPFKALANHSRFQRELKDLEHEANRLRDSLKAMEANFKALKAERDVQPPNTIEWDRKNLVLEQAVTELQGLSKMYGEEVKRKQMALEAKGYEEIAKAVDKVARERGLSLVLRVHEDPAPGSIGERLRIYDRRIVWFAATEIDITVDVGRVLEAGLVDDRTQPSTETGAKK